MTVRIAPPKPPKHCVDTGRRWDGSVIWRYVVPSRSKYVPHYGAKQARKDAK